MGQIYTLLIVLLALVNCTFALPRSRVGTKDAQTKRVKRDDASQYMDVIDVTSEPNLRSPGMIDDVLISGGMQDSESNNLVSDSSYEQQQDDGELGDIVANLPLADESEDDDVDLTLYPQGWNDQTVDDGDDGQVYERRKRNIAAAVNLSQNRLHNKNKHSSRTARKQLERARHPAQTAAKKNRTKRGAPYHPQQQTLSDEDLLSLILLADQMQARKQQQYRDQYTHPRRPMISDEDPLLTAALLAAQAEDEESILDAYQPEDDDEVYMPAIHGRGRLAPMYSSKVYQDQYGPIEFTDNGYRRSGYRQPYLPGQKRSSRNAENDKLYAIAQMLGKPHEQKASYRRQRA